MSTFEQQLAATFPPHAMEDAYQRAIADNPEAAERIAAWRERAKAYVLAHAATEFYRAGGDPATWEKLKERVWEEILIRETVEGQTTMAARRSLRDYNSRYKCPDLG